MTLSPEDADARLERLRRATGSARSRPGFVDRVAAAVDREAVPDWIGDLTRAARKLIPIAAVAAALGVAWATASERAWNDAIAASADLDVEW